MIKVLIVDDERLIREGLASIINWKDQGFELIGLARNGEEALDLSAKFLPDLVITDIQMPKMDGLTLIENLYELYPDIKVVILSGYGEFDYAVKAMRYGIKYYLLKPFAEDKLLEVLDKVKKELEISSKELNTYTDDAVTGKGNKWIKDILKCVDENLAKPELSLKWIANEFMFVNAGYLSRIFNKEMEDTFPHYVMERRMERAKELIRNCDGEKVYQVAEKIGLGNNPQYFSQLFKSYTGITPKEYKNKYLKGEIMK